MTEGSGEQDGTAQEACGILDAAWIELRRSLFVQRQLSLPLTELPDLSLEETQRHSAVGASLLRRIDSVDLRSLSHDLALSMRAVRFRAHCWSREADWYWTVIDPLKVGFFGFFLPTAYCGGYLFSVLNSQLAAFRFADSAATDRYLSLVADYSRLIDQFTARTIGQARQGMLMPKSQIIQARALLRNFRSGAREVFLAAPRQFPTLHNADSLRELEGEIASRVEPAFDRALDCFSDDYLATAPEDVGAAQYPQGAAIYAELVKFHTTLDLTPEHIHARGRERLGEINSQKQAIRTELGFAGDDAAFVAHLNENPRWRASTVEGVTAMFTTYIDRIKPHLGELFSALPKAPYSVAPLSAALQGSMTYGYFDPPRKDHPEGVYRFNAGNSTKRALLTLGALTYHELVPGHHLQIGLQCENEALHPFRQYSLVTAYTEGWAEYAATLAGEIGMYREVAERYGRLLNDGFLTSRLVVDTGMNALGWSLERARDFMRQNSGISEAEVLTESLRYSCDIPGQALAYKIGDEKMLQLRARWRAHAGSRFDLRSFHSVLLSTGAIPLPELEWHFERAMETGVPT